MHAAAAACSTCGRLCMLLLHAPPAGAYCYAPSMPAPAVAHLHMPLAATHAAARAYVCLLSLHMPVRMHTGTVSACAHFLFLLMKTPETGSTCCNIRLKHVKYLEHTRATYVYSHCNICNIQIKHLQHTCKTAKTCETYTCNIRV